MTYLPEYFAFVSDLPDSATLSPTYPANYCTLPTHSREPLNQHKMQNYKKKQSHSWKLSPKHFQWAIVNSTSTSRLNLKTGSAAVLPIWMATAVSNWPLSGTLPEGEKLSLNPQTPADVQLTHCCTHLFASWDNPQDPRGTSRDSEV